MDLTYPRPGQPDFRPLKRATVNESAEVWKLLQTCPEYLDAGTRGALGGYVVNGYVIWERGVALVTRPWHQKTYYGLSAYRGWQVLQLIASTKGDGSALEVMTRWHQEMAPRRTFLFVKTDNARGIAFYKKLGYRVYTTVVWPTFSSDLMYRDPIEC